GQASHKTFGLKPVSAGCERTDEGLRNGDALEIMAAANVSLSYDQVNPIAYEPPIAPHIAAKQKGKMLSADRIAAYCKGSMMTPADFVLVEGAGGWRVPLSHRETFANIAKSLNLPVIIVVGMKLGCINHALLTVESVMRDGLPVAGWVANRIDPEMAAYEENIETLKAMMPAPLLGEVPYLDNPSAATVASHLRINELLKP
ncbi:MAG: dethiobiotin synthase, partial [Pontibacterium sp.]